MSERELVVLAGASARRSAGAGVHVVAADPTVLTVALDTWETCRFLATHGLQHAGPAGSRGMRLVASRDEISATTWGCEDGSVRGPESYRRGLSDTAVAELRADAEVDAEARLS
jgi:hypothetical protein